MNSKTGTAISKTQAVEAATAGLDFLVRHQITDENNANCGRFLCRYNCQTHESIKYTSNWMTGVCVEAMLVGHKYTGNQEYLDAAEKAVKYIASLQVFSPEHDNMFGLIRETTPQTVMAHPRDALTAAWAMLDWSEYSGQENFLKHSVLYAEWFLNVGMEKGYPYWTVRMDDEPWLPQWFGSFQSGGAFYFYRLFNITGDLRYKEAIFKILDHYNKYHLEQDGSINVAVDMQTYAPLIGHEEAAMYSPLGWEMMHKYNDDFGALANLAAYHTSKNPDYLHAAQRFLEKMITTQRHDGGFGPEDYSVPSAGGSVLIELIAAAKFVPELASPEVLNSTVNYLLDLQVRQQNSPADGAFRGFDDNYNLSELSNSRTAAYSIMGLLRYAGAVDDYYFLDF